MVAGRSAGGDRVQVLISDYQSTGRAFRLRVEKLPWTAGTQIAVKRWLIDREHHFEVVEESTASGQELTPSDLSIRARLVWSSCGSYPEPEIPLVALRCPFRCMAASRVLASVLPVESLVERSIGGEHAGGYTPFEFDVD